MIRNSGHADLPLHTGTVPRWLADRMMVLGTLITESLVENFGPDEVLVRLSDPLWFQSFGAVMGMDWHSSGITTSVMYALKRGVNPRAKELGIYVCGGRGKYSRMTPDELLEIALDKIVHGEVALVTLVTQFTGSVFSARMGFGSTGAGLSGNAVLKVPNRLEKDLPFVVRKKKNGLKWGVLGVLILILALIVLLLSSGTMRFGIDATGDKLLKRSRNMESSAESEVSPNLKVDSLLLELPVPAAE